MALKAHRRLVARIESQGDMRLVATGNDGGAVDEIETIKVRRKRRQRAHKCVFEQGDIALV